MLNIDTRLFSKVDCSEMWMLMHLSKRVGVKERTCWPSNKTLCKDTGWHIEKVQKVKKALIDKGLIEVIMRPEQSNIYKIKTRLIGIYMGIEDFEFMDTGNSDTTPIGNAMPIHAGKSDSKQLTIEVLTKEQDMSDHVNQVIEYMNSTRAMNGMKSKLTRTDSRERIISARLKDFKVSDIFKVISFKFEQWANDERMSQYLTLETLLRASNFPKYLEAAGDQPAKEWTQRDTVATSNTDNPW